MTPPPSMECSFDGCEFITPPAIPTYELMVKALELHIQAHTYEKSKIVKVEKPKRPTLTVNMAETDWTFFEHKWERYKRQSGITGQQVIDEVWACLDADLERLAFQDGIHSTNGEELLQKIKSLAVSTVHPSLHVVNLHSLQQSDSETVKAFSARVRGVAKNCNLTKQCTSASCTENVSFEEETCYHVTMTGIRHEELKEKILTQAMIGGVKDLPSLLEYATAEESAKLRHPVRAVAAVTKQGSQKKCFSCGQACHGEYNKRRKTECKAYGKKCSKCGKMHHFAQVCRSQKVAAIDITDTEKNEDSDPAPSVSGFIASILPTLSITSPSKASHTVALIKDASAAAVTTLPVPHYVYSKQIKSWKRSPPKASPTVEVSISLDRPAYKELGLNAPDLVRKAGAGYARARTATPDTGAQLTVMNESELQTLGIKKNSIFPLALSINTVTKQSIDLIGGVFLKFTMYNRRTNTTVLTRQLCYISKTVHGIYLSEEACSDLQLIPVSFPQPHEEHEISTIVKTTKKCSNTGVGPDSSTVCSCPRRTLPPEDEPQLPCAPTKENLQVIKQYILDRYASSGFNCCEQQKLPLMASAPPLRLFVDKQATPVAAMKPSAIPLHWTDDVKAGLDRDEKLGVIEKVPVNVPVKWCSRMVVTPKSDGTPRRVIDFSPINRHAPRQAHHTRSPYMIATSVPAQKVKSVLDNWHGYHSVPIHPDDRPLTTFITPFGRYQYKTVPQGFISAGDGYTQRMDLIVEGTQNFDNCVDDSILWDDDIEKNFYSVCSFIEKCSRAGCIFNPDKFQFGSEEVEFLGFKITSSGLMPTDSFLETIRNFPIPQNISEVRGWFGTINQISYSFAVSPQMEPFRKLLSSKLPFAWSESLNSAFIASKEEILRQCANGVRKFEPNRLTALATDWSKSSVGCWLTQKFCDCDSKVPGCCKTGWQTIHVASKFNSPAVSNYHPVEGEAYAAAWSLEKCKIFVLGNPNLILAVDHKPLLAILGPNQELAEVINPRLMNFKLKSMSFKFQPMHIPGKRHVVPDTMSRRNDSPILKIPKPSRAPPTTNNVLPGYSDTFGPPSWVAAPDVGKNETGLQKGKDVSLRVSSEDKNLISSLQVGKNCFDVSSDEKSAFQSPYIGDGCFGMSSDSNSTFQSSYTGDGCFGVSSDSKSTCNAQIEDTDSLYLGYAMSNIAAIASSNPDAGNQLLTWDLLSQECSNCPVYKKLHEAVTLADNSACSQPILKPYTQVFPELTTLGNVVMLHNRIVVPTKLQPNVLQHLHSAHSGVQTMSARALESVYWPGYRKDIENTRRQCISCNRYAPSNPPTFSTPTPDLPLYPFQVICSDFF